MHRNTNTNTDARGHADAVTNCYADTYSDPHATLYRHIFQRELRWSNRARFARWLDGDQRSG